MKNKTHLESTLPKNLAHPRKETPLILSSQDYLELIDQLTTIAKNATHPSKPSVVIVAKNLQHARILKLQTVIFDKHINLKFSIEKKSSPADHSPESSTHNSFDSLYKDIVDEGKLNDLLEYKIDNTVVKCTMLHYLISSGHFHLIKRAIKDGAKIEALDADHRNSLTYFAQYIDSYCDTTVTDVLKFLIRKFCDHYKDKGKKPSILDFGADCTFNLVCRVKNTGGFEQLDKENKELHRDFNKIFAVRCLKVLIKSGLSLGAINEYNPSGHDQRLNNIKTGLLDLVQKGLVPYSSINLKRAYSKILNDNPDNQKAKRQKTEPDNTDPKFTEIKEEIGKIAKTITTHLKDIQDKLDILINQKQGSEEFKDCAEEIEASAKPINHEANFSGEDSAQSSESDMY